MGMHQQTLDNGKEDLLVFEPPHFEPHQWDFRVDAEITRAWVLMRRSQNRFLVPVPQLYTILEVDEDAVAKEENPEK